MNSSRVLTNEEFELAGRVKMDYEKRRLLVYSQVEYERQGNFTVCLIGGNGGSFVGVTKRMVGDSDRPHEAERIAFRRAVEAYAVS